jgi:hypothetical protein
MDNFPGRSRLRDSIDPFGLREQALPLARTRIGLLHDLGRSQMYDIHPQTLRLYEREGLIKPSGTASRIGNRMIMVLARMAEIVLVPV